MTIITDEMLLYYCNLCFKLSLYRIEQHNGDITQFLIQSSVFGGSIRLLVNGTLSEKSSSLEEDDSSDEDSSTI